VNAILRYPRKPWVCLRASPVFHPREPGLVPDTPPLIAIEILSPDDLLTEVREKLEEYRAWGVPHELGECRNVSRGVVASLRKSREWPTIPNRSNVAQPACWPICPAVMRNTHVRPEDFEGVDSGPNLIDNVACSKKNHFRRNYRSFGVLLRIYPGESSKVTRFRHSTIERCDTLAQEG
jgi:hypothetical protein